MGIVSKGGQEVQYTRLGVDGNIIQIIKSGNDVKRLTPLVYDELHKIVAWPYAWRPRRPHAAGNGSDQ